jgi:hypothetical protein
MTSQLVSELRAAVRLALHREREAGYRRALEAIGAMPQTIELMVERDRDWIRFDVSDEDEA